MYAHIQTIWAFHLLMDFYESSYEYSQTYSTVPSGVLCA